MMYINSNRSAAFLLALASLITVGCSETPNEPVVIEDGSWNRPIADWPYKPSTTTTPKPRASKARSGKGYAGPHNTVWDRMLSLYALPEVNSERVDRQLNWYLDHPDYVARIQERAAPYMHLILDEIEAKNLPGELALLPVVESAFIAEAYSHSDASGLWQFIPSTGRFFGLKQNSWYDGRRDVYASTKAATSFLRDLGDTFGGDWCLALASYNYGKGNVWKAIEKNEYNNRPTDYWSLDLPQETEDYVPRLLAIAKLFANADKYHIPLKHIPNQAYCAVVNVGSQMDLDVAAELAGMPLEHFLKLNPGFKRDSTAPEGPHHLLVPVSRLQRFKENLAQLPYDERVDQTSREADQTALRQRTEQQHFAEKERREKQIDTQRDREEQRSAQREHLNAQRLAEKNHRDDMFVQRQKDAAEAEKKRRDTQLLTQSRREKEHNTDEPLASNREHDDAPTFTGRYKVKSGESLSIIATRHHTTIKALREANHLSVNSVNSGTYLRVPALKNSDASTTVAEIKDTTKEHKSKSDGDNKTENSKYYIVKHGDTFWSVSQKFSLSTKTLADWNNLSSHAALRSGQKLVVRGGGTGGPSQQQVASSSSTRLIHYTVKKGDTLTQICKKFGVSAADLRKSNPDGLSKGLRSGLKLKILTESTHPTI